MKANTGGTGAITPTTQGAVTNYRRLTTPPNAQFNKLPSNRNSRSLSYNTVNNRVIFLDALFHQNEATIPGFSAAWAAAAADYAGMTMCACRDSNITPQKLFRVTNLWNGMNGNPDSNIPFSLAGRPFLNCQNVANFFLLPTGPRTIFIGTGFGSGEYDILMNVGLGLDNPIFPIRNSNPNCWYSTLTPPGSVIANYPWGKLMSFCCFYLDGCPGNSGVCPTQYFP